MRHNQGNCLVALLALFALFWLVFMGGCQLICKKTEEGLQDKPATTQPVEAPIKAPK